MSANVLLTCQKESAAFDAEAKKSIIHLHCSLGCAAMGVA
jgi:hypothetical protein